MQFEICLLLCQWRFGELVFVLEKSEWTRGKRKLCMLPCHECYIYRTWRKKEVRGLKLWHGRKLMGGKQQRVEQFLWGTGGTDSSASLSELPTYFSLFWCKKRSMICAT